MCAGVTVFGPDWEIWLGHVVFVGAMASLVPSLCSAEVGGEVGKGDTEPQPQALSWKSVTLVQGSSGRDPS